MLICTKAREISVALGFRHAVRVHKYETLLRLPRGESMVLIMEICKTNDAVTVLFFFLGQLRKWCNFRDS